MKLIITSFAFLFISCASHNRSKIAINSQDGLRFESLSRYSSDRLNLVDLKNKTIALCQKMDYNESLQSFQDNLDKNLTKFNYWNQISTCYIRKQETSKAKYFLNIAMSRAKTKKQKSIVLNNYAVIYMKNENFYLAKDYLKKSLTLAPDSKTPRFNLAKIYLRHSLYNKAQEQLDFLLKRSPLDIDFNYSYGHLLLMQKKYNHALLYFNNIPESFKTRDDIATNLAMTYLMLGKNNIAKKYLKRANKSTAFFSNAQAKMLKHLEK